MEKVKTSDPRDDRPRKAIESAPAWSGGQATVAEAWEAAFAAHAAARSASDDLGPDLAAHIRVVIERGECIRENRLRRYLGRYLKNISFPR